MTHYHVNHVVSVLVALGLPGLVTIGSLIAARTVKTDNEEN